jgi:hypothetical protein
MKRLVGLLQIARRKILKGRNIAKQGMRSKDVAAASCPLFSEKPSAGCRWYIAAEPDCLCSLYRHPGVENIGRMPMLQ